MPVATLSVRPSSSQTSVAIIVTLTGTGTLWSTHLPSTLFSISALTGCSLGDPTITSDTSATAMLTLGAMPGTITFTDTTTGATDSFTVVLALPPVPPSPPPLSPTTGYLSCGVDYDWFDPLYPPLVPVTVPFEVDTWTGVVLAGTEVDFRFSILPVFNPGISSYDTISWTATIDPTCTWLRLAGSYWNTAGQTSPPRFITLASGSYGGDFFLLLTASGINPPPTGGLKANGTYSTTVVVNYTATGPGGASYTGVLLVKFAIRVLQANRYASNLPMPLSWGGVNTNMQGYPIYGPCDIANPDTALVADSVLAILQTLPGIDFSFTLPLPFVYDSGAVASPLLAPTSIAYYILTVYTPIITSYAVFLDTTWNALYGVSWSSSLDPAYNPDIEITPPSAFPRYIGGIGTGLTPLSDVVLLRPLGAGDGAGGSGGGGGYYTNGHTPPAIGLLLAETDLWTVDQSLSGSANYPYWKYIHYYSCAKRTPLGTAPSPPVCNVDMTVFGGLHPGSTDPGAIPFDFTGNPTFVQVDYRLDFHGIVDTFVTTPDITVLSPPSVSSGGFGSTADPLVYQGTFLLFLSNAPDTSPGIHGIHFGDLSWLALGASSPCIVNLIAHVTIPGTVTTTTTTTTTTASGSTTTTTTAAGATTTTTTSTTTTTTIAPAPPGYIRYEGPPVDESGAALHKVPFKLNVSPIEIRVQADPRSGLLSGDFQVGIHIQPGPMARSQVGGVVDLVRLYADGINVQFFSQLPQEKSKNKVVLQLDPLNWDLRNGFVYDLTFQLSVQSLLPAPFLVDLNTTDSIPTMLDAMFSRNNFMLESGANETILVAVKVSGTDIGRRVLVVEADPGSNNVSVVPSGAVINLDPTVITIPVLYQITGASSYTFTVASVVNQHFTTIHGIGSTESWGVNDIDYLARHGLRFSSAGVLTTDSTVLGPPESKDVMVFVEQPLSSGEKAYASKIVTINIV